MKLDYFKDCVIGTELKLDLFLERNQGLMYEIAGLSLRTWINLEAIVLRFYIKSTSSDACRIGFELLINGEYCEREIVLDLPKQVEA